VRPRPLLTFAVAIALAACDDRSVIVARVRASTTFDASLDDGPVRPRACGTRLNPVGCACTPGVDRTRPCVSFDGPVCATGVAQCIGVGEVGVWGHCEGLRPGACTCTTEGEVRECSEGPCGVSATRCLAGQWGPCSAPSCIDAGLDADSDAGNDVVAETTADVVGDSPDTEPLDGAPDAMDAADVRDETDVVWTDGATDRPDADVVADRVDAGDVADAPIDRPDVVDAPPDVPACMPTIVDVTTCVTPLAAPRPVAPLAFSRVTSRRPTLEWALPGGVNGALVELCRDRDCGVVIERVIVTGTSMRPSCPLPPGVVFWRLAGARDGAPGCMRTASSPVWQMDVGASDTGDTSWGVRFDANGDGYRDIILRSGAMGIEPGSVAVALGGVSGFGASGSIRTLTPATGFVAFGAEAIPAGDMNGDGYGDLLVRSTALGTDDDVDRVYLGGPTGIVAMTGRDIEQRYTLAGLENTQFASGDFDQDGYGDLVIVRTHVPREVTTMVPRLMQPRVDVYRGGPTGPAPGGPTAFIDTADASVFFGALTVADFDGDRRPEIALGARGEVIVIYDPLRAPRLVRTLRRPDVSDSQRFGEDFLWAADVNGDGRGDLVVLGTGAIGTPGTWTWQGSATGLSAGFTDRLTNALYWGVADVNHDGLDDLGARADGTGYAFYVSNGRMLVPTFRYRVGVPSTTSAALVGDADGDGDVDVVLRDRATNALLLYRGGPPGTFTGPVRAPLPTDAPTGPAGNGAMAW
jgi:hypothetical protein